MKASKNLGISKACPECGKTIIKSANFEGEGSFETKCVHCGKLVRVGITQRQSVSVIAVVAFLIAVASATIIISNSGYSALAQLLDFSR